MSVPDPALTDWVPLYNAGAQPIPPLVDNKWLKSSGGAMVWADLPAATMPSRLGTTAKAIYVETPDDWNSAIDNGWYMSSTAANSPVGGTWWIGMVTQHNSAWIQQEVWAFTD